MLLPATAHINDAYFLRDSAIISAQNNLLIGECAFAVQQLQELIII
jgi:hypothetical protein